jgi:hypothetical protein
LKAYNVWSIESVCIQVLMYKKAFFVDRRNAFEGSRTISWAKYGGVGPAWEHVAREAGFTRPLLILE